MLTRFPSVSVKETYRPMPGISTGLPLTFPPESLIFFIAFLISSTAMTTDVNGPPVLLG